MLFSSRVGSQTLIETNLKRVEVMIGCIGAIEMTGRSYSLESQCKFFSTNERLSRVRTNTVVSQTNHTKHLFTKDVNINEIP